MHTLRDIRTSGWRIGLLMAVLALALVGPSAAETPGQAVPSVHAGPHPATPDTLCPVADRPAQAVLPASPVLPLALYERTAQDTIRPASASRLSLESLLAAARPAAHGEVWLVGALGHYPSLCCLYSVFRC